MENGDVLRVVSLSIWGTRDPVVGMIGEREVSGTY
jgi:hypothetical protein